MKATGILRCLAVLGVFAVFFPLAAGPPKKSRASRTNLAVDTQPVGALTAPLIGFAATGSDSAMELRPIEGVPGASVFGLPVPLPEGVERIHVAPGNAFAVLQMAEETGIIVLHLKPEGGAVCQPLPEAVPSPSAVAFSPSGRLAALLSPDRERVQVFDPQSGPTPVLEAAFPGSPLSGIAVSDRGELLAIDRSGAVWSAAQSAAPVPVHRGVAPAALAFAPDSGRAVLWDSGEHSLYLLERLDGAWASRPAASGPEGIEGDIILRVLSDGHAVLLIARQAPRVWRIGLSEPSIESLEMPVEPLGLDALRLRDTFLLRTGPDGVSWLLSGAGSQPQVVFVPAVAGEGERQ